MSRMIILLIIGMLGNLHAQAYTENISLNINQVELTKVRNSYGDFTKLNGAFTTLQEVGAPELPVKAVLLVGHPNDLSVNIDILDRHTLENTLPYPAQPERVRNLEVKVDNKFYFNQQSYKNSQRSSLSKVEYLGDYKGVPISQVKISLGEYNARNNSVTLYTNVRVDTEADQFQLPDGDNKDYLILVQQDLKEGLSDFIKWKEFLGFNIKVVELLSPEITSENIRAIVAENYNDGALDFTLFIGNAIPFLTAKTSDGSTPSDLGYFTMGGADDFVPDVYFGRIPGTTPEEVFNRLQKSIEFERKIYKNDSGLKHVIGIASNEGHSPSDNEYITSIEESFENSHSYSSTHFYENNSNSNPDELNRELDNGAKWLFYMGHGSGSSWPSMYKTYTVSHINLIENLDSVKPIIVDVACLNGRVKDGYLGTTFSTTLTSVALGSTAYYGGTVNISWHPPAIMARGVAYEHTKNNFAHLGQALLAGQLYLAANWSNQTQIVDNFEWYVLQGDPSLNIKN